MATAGLSPGDIASPIRSVLRHKRNANVVLAKVSGIDAARKEVLAEGRRILFDYLIVATGAEHAYFGHEAWAASAPGSCLAAERPPKPAPMMTTRGCRVVAELFIGPSVTKVLIRTPSCK